MEISIYVLIKDRVDISNRSSIVEVKKPIGDIEGDTIVGIKDGAEDCLLILVDRVSKYIIKKTQGHLHVTLITN